MLALSATAATGSVQIALTPVAGGFLADDNGDGAWDRAVPGSQFVVGKANHLFGTESREFQGAYEWNLFDPALVQISSGLIVEVKLSFTRTSYSGNGYAPSSIQGTAAGYVGDGSFGFGDVSAGSSVATFPIFNWYASWPQPDPALDVTSLVLAVRNAGNQFVGFNLRTEVALPYGATIGDGFASPELVIVAVPEPSAWTLLGLGIPGLIALRRRQA